MLTKIYNKITGNNLQKATITVKSTHEVIPCQFNPEELTVHRANNWTPQPKPMLNSPVLQFTGGAATTCHMHLFFDTSDSGDDVRAYTNQLLKLTLKKKGAGKKGIFSKPPTVIFGWGKFQLFRAVISDVSIKYMMFLPNGTPIRARAEVTFMQNDHDDDPQAAQNPTSRTEPRKVRVVQSGERLDTIANEEYGHPRYWRTLAEANNLDHVEQLAAGLVLIIPPLE